MALREFFARHRNFFARHRIASAVAAPAVLGIAAIVAASFALTSAPQTRDTRLTSSVTECHDMVTISVAGRGDTPVAGSTKLLVDANGAELPAALSDDYHSEWVDPVVNAPAGSVDPGSYAAVYVAYPANMDSYEDAVTAGVANTQQVMREISQACPDTRFAIVGYSEGADVVRRVATTIGHQEPGADGKYGIVDPAAVTGVVILADAGRRAGEGPFPGAQDPYGSPDGFDQRYQNAAKPVAGQGVLPGTSGDFGALNGKVASFCSDGDLTCSAPQNISLLQLAVNVGRQLNVDALERDGLTPATGQDVAGVVGRIAFLAFQDIRSQPNWMASDETFLQVLLRVSDPEYRPGQAPTAPQQAGSIAVEEMSPLAYLPQKLFNEVVGLILTNRNTIPVLLSDPYQQTFGPNHTGRHFDYWNDADPAAGKPLTSAEYAAAWLTQLARQAQAGEPVDTKAVPKEEDLAAAYRAAAASTSASATPPASAATSGSGSSTTAPTTASTSSSTSSSPTTDAEGRTTTSVPTTTGGGSTTTESSVTVSTTPAPPARTAVRSTTEIRQPAGTQVTTTEPDSTTAAPSATATR
ncbi:cutinase family protein [Nocardia sp. BMG51109]|uniref:cutinase family protein n=1 Tax=Nocardia sp. BMG51109 TaxID=1056816 RepID=UPI000463E0C0|nr:cutinase family protein [Nocardia sp. BMG51109]